MFKCLLMYFAIYINTDLHIIFLLPIDWLHHQESHNLCKSAILDWWPSVLKDEASSFIEGLVKLSLNSVLVQIFSIRTSWDVIEACPKYQSVNFCSHFLSLFNLYSQLYHSLVSWMVMNQKLHDLRGNHVIYHFVCDFVTPLGKLHERVSSRWLHRLKGTKKRTQPTVQWLKVVWICLGCLVDLHFNIQRNLSVVQM